jgi:hypothetical protein
MALLNMFIVQIEIYMFFKLVVVQKYALCNTGEPTQNMCGHSIVYAC